MTTDPIHPRRTRLEAFLAADPLLARLREAAPAEPLFLVGGAIRDVLCGVIPDDIDLVIEGDPGPLANRLDPAARIHDRFGTAELTVDGTRVDLARARTETYPHPGALPVVESGSIDDDLARRDFSINAIAVGLSAAREGELLDPHHGLEDLEAGLLRVLHPGSFSDDPTRAIRGARYAARLGFALAPETAVLLATIDLSTVSTDRRREEILLLAGEETALDGFGLLEAWGLLEPAPDGRALAERALELLCGDLWRGAADRALAVMAAFLDPPREAIGRLMATPASPYEGLRLAAAHGPVELLLARAAGAEWLDLWRKEWRSVRLEISGADLLAAGVPEGPGIGAGLEAALRARLDRRVSGAAAELEVALAAAAGRS